MPISTIEITLIKVRGNNVDFSTIEITSKKVRGNNADFSTIEITSKKVRGNHVDFSTSEITSKKVRGNHVDFSTIEITSKKYAEMTWKFVEIWSSTYRRNIHVESTWIRCGVPVGLTFKQQAWSYAQLHKHLDLFRRALLASVTFCWECYNIWPLFANLQKAWDT